jgi:hypothetical protein
MSCWVQYRKGWQSSHGTPHKRWVGCDRHVGRVVRARTAESSSRSRAHCREGHGAVIAQLPKQRGKAVQAVKVTSMREQRTWQWMGFPLEFVYRRSGDSYLLSLGRDPTSKYLMSGVRNMDEPGTSFLIAWCLAPGDWCLARSASGLRLALASGAGRGARRGARGAGARRRARRRGLDTL